MSSRRSMSLFRRPRGAPHRTFREGQFCVSLRIDVDDPVEVLETFPPMKLPSCWSSNRLRGIFSGISTRMLCPFVWKGGTAGG